MPSPALLCLMTLLAAPAERPPVGIAGPGQVRVDPGTLTMNGRSAVVEQPVTLTVPPVEWVSVADEPIAKLPLRPEDAPAWRKGLRLRGVTTQETTARFMVDPDSLRLDAGEGNAEAFERGVDWDADPEWGVIWRLPDGRIGAEQPVFVDYRHGQGRLDTIAVAPDGSVRLVVGEPHLNMARPPALAEGELPLANVWQPTPIKPLDEASLFPITETAYPEPEREGPAPAETLLPKTLAKLRAGGTVRVLAWGDSVTNGGFVGDPAKRWQEQFVSRLRERFPTATIELETLGWGGRNTASFLAEPPGSQWNYQEQVVGRKPDLIVSEFVNDAYLKPEQVEERYGQFLADFQGIGAEWIILTPHYVRPDWMGLPAERDIDDDPRAYVKGLREFTARHNVALADASLRYGRLWRQGIPYTTLLMNAINHPDERGMTLFADALMALFPE